MLVSLTRCGATVPGDFGGDRGFGVHPALPRWSCWRKHGVSCSCSVPSSGPCPWRAARSWLSLSRALGSCCRPPWTCGRCRRPSAASRRWLLTPRNLPAWRPWCSSNQVRPPPAATTGHPHVPPQPVTPLSLQRPVAWRTLSRWRTCRTSHRWCWASTTAPTTPGNPSGTAVPTSSRVTPGWDTHPWPLLHPSGLGSCCCSSQRCASSPRSAWSCSSSAAPSATPPWRSCCVTCSRTEPPSRCHLACLSPCAGTPSPPAWALKVAMVPSPGQCPGLWNAAGSWEVGAASLGMSPSECPGHCHHLTGSISMVSQMLEEPRQRHLGTMRSYCHPGGSLGDTNPGMIQPGVTSAKGDNSQGWCQPGRDTSPGVTLAKGGDTWEWHQTGTGSGWWSQARADPGQGWPQPGVTHGDRPLSLHLCPPFYTRNKESFAARVPVPMTWVPLDGGLGGPAEC